MDRIRTTFIPLFILFIILSLVVIFRSFLLTYIIEPVALMFWVFWRILSSVEQIIYWTVLIVSCAILIIRLIPSKKDKPPNSTHNYIYAPPNRIKHWQTLLSDAPLGKNESEDLRDSLEELLIAVSAQKKHPNPTALEEIGVKGNLPLSPAAQCYLFPSKTKHGIFSTNYQPNLMFLIPRWLQKRAKIRNRQDIILLDEILRWLETELEISTEFETDELETNYEQ